MRFTILASGSEGNALLIEAGQTRLLIDCGLPSAREVERRLLMRGVEPASVTALLLTHEHADHVQSAATFARRFSVPVHASWGTLSAWTDSQRVPRLCPFDSHADLALQDLLITPLPVPHDAREPTQFLFSDGQHRLGLLTDLGSLTPFLRRTLAACDALILEANHDCDMLINGSYPAHLKRRILGDYGHLSNEQAASLLADLDERRLQHIIAAHLSQENNDARLVRQVLAARLCGNEERIEIAAQNHGLDWRVLN